MRNDTEIVNKDSSFAPYVDNDDDILSFSQGDVDNLLNLSPSRASVTSTGNAAESSTPQEKLQENEIFILDDDEYIVNFPQGYVTPEGIAEALFDKINETSNNEESYLSTPECSKFWDFSGEDVRGNKIDTIQNTSSSCYKCDYGFEVLLEPSIKRKTGDYIFVAEKECIYAKPFLPVPFLLQFSSIPPPHAIIRVYAFYADPTCSSEPIGRCPVHLTADNRNTRYHFILIDDSEAIYFNEAAGTVDRPHVAISVSNLNSIFVPIIFQCFSSCVGGINRRPVRLCFVFEIGNLRFGERHFYLKVCACPSRDANIDEEQHTPAAKRRRKCITPYLVDVITPTKLERSNSSFLSEDDDTVYEIQIRGRHLYKLICSIVSSYELSRRYVHEKRASSPSTIKTLPPHPNSISSKMSIASWLAGLKQTKYEALFRENTLYFVGDLEGKMTKNFLLSLGIQPQDATIILNSYLSWFNVFNAERLSSLSSDSSPSILIHRTRLRSAIRK